MPPKRKRSNKESTIPAADSLETLTYDAAQALIRRLMTQFDINPTDSPGQSDSFSLWNPVFCSFSKVTYAQVAPLVGLDPDLELQDISTFEIHRSRILQVYC
jgi:hypothetical protein